MLTAAVPDEEGNSDVGWNFTKFLIDGQGTVLARFAPTITPEGISEKLPTYR
ncbi:MAG: hypothetical protein P8J17_02040 [Halioglobus sp.]|nr:hypothetical protein [Halioglobus sp.]